MTTITTQQVMNTNHFKSMSKIRQKLYKTRNNVKAIENGVNVSLNIGFDKWQEQTQSNWDNIQIIKELLKQ